MTTRHRQIVHQPLLPRRDDLRPPHGGTIVDTGLADVGLAGAGAVLTAASALHLYWLGGGRRARSAVIPTRHGAPVMSPGPVATLVVAGLLGAAATLYLGTARRWQPRWMCRLGTGTAGVVLLGRALGDGRTMGMTKTVTVTPFARLDDTVLTPLCAALGLAGVIGATRQ